MLGFRSVSVHAFFPLALLLSTGSGAIASDPYDAAVERALRLLPRRPERVVVVDIEHATASVRDHLDHADGFVTTGLRIVYLRQ